MKNLFDQNDHRLDRGEKEAIWRRIANAPVPGFPSRRLAPVVSVAAVVAIAVAWVWYFSRSVDQTAQRGPDRAPPSEYAEVADEPSTLPYLLELLAVKDSGIDTIPMSPDLRKDRIIEALKRIVLKGSEIRPLIMAIEDLHWVDKSSEESFSQLLENISGARVLLIFTYRPDPTWHTTCHRSLHS